MVLVERLAIRKLVQHVSPYGPPLPEWARIEFDGMILRTYCTGKACGWTCSQKGPCDPVRMKFVTVKGFVWIGSTVWIWYAISIPGMGSGYIVPITKKGRKERQLASSIW